MRFEEVYERWTEHRLTQQEEADLLSVSERQFRRQCRRYESDGLGQPERPYTDIPGRATPQTQPVSNMRNVRSR